MPIDRGVIDQQLNAIGEGPRWWDRRELRDLPSVLAADEQILAIATGKAARVRWLHRSWLIVVTEGRLICLQSGRRSWRQMEVAGDRIIRVSLRVGPLHGRVRVGTVGHRYRFLIPRSQAYKIVTALRSIAPQAQELAAGAGMVRRVIDHVMALPVAVTQPVPPTTPVTPPRLPAASSRDEERVQQLESEIYDLQQQVRFLEDLLKEKQTTVPPA